jgi:hypothetical protein
MTGALDPTPFDEVIFLWTDEREYTLVTHRNAAGEVFAWHSPLDDGPVCCSICESGARVYLNTEGD